MNTEKRKTGLAVLLNNKVFTTALILAIMVIIAIVFAPNFLSAYNMSSVFRDLAFIGMIAIAQSCLLLLGELDLSVGSVAALCGVIGGNLMVFKHVNGYLAFVIAILLGALCGAINGTLITRLNLNAMVLTIGMDGVDSGITLVLTKGKAVTGIPEEIFFLGKGSLLKIPMPFVFTIIVLIVIVFLMRRTVFGRYVYAIGNSRNTAEILGIRVKRIRTAVFSIVGAVCGLAGMLMVARLGSSQPTIGANWPMNSIASSVIGGMALTGGIGNPIGALLGAAIISVIQNFIVLIGVNAYWQSVVSGVVVVAAISLDSIITILRSRPKKAK